MVIKYGCNPKEVWLLESSSQSGVAITKWSDIKHAVGTDLTVAHRHLVWNRPASSLQIIEQFIKETEGAKYSHLSK